MVTRYPRATSRLALWIDCALKNLRMMRQSMVPHTSYRFQNWLPYSGHTARLFNKLSVKTPLLSFTSEVPIRSMYDAKMAIKSAVI